MFRFEESIEVLTTPEEALKAVGDFLHRGHFAPDSLSDLKIIEPRPTNEIEQFLPGQKASFKINGVYNEHCIAEVQEWDEAEARILERPVRPLAGERIEWRLAELMPGTIKITLTFSAQYSGLNKLTLGRTVHKFWLETMKRLKHYLDDKYSYAQSHTYAKSDTGSSG